MGDPGKADPQGISLQSGSTSRMALRALARGASEANSRPWRSQRVGLKGAAAHALLCCLCDTCGRSANVTGPKPTTSETEQLSKVYIKTNSHRRIKTFLLCPNCPMKISLFRPSPVVSRTYRIEVDHAHSRSPLPSIHSLALLYIRCEGRHREPACEARDRLPDRHYRQV